MTQSPDSADTYRHGKALLPFVMAARHRGLTVALHQGLLALETRPSDATVLAVESLLGQALRRLPVAGTA